MCVHIFNTYHVHNISAWYYSATRSHALACLHSCRYSQNAPELQKHVDLTLSSAENRIMVCAHAELIRQSTWHAGCVADHLTPNNLATSCEFTLQYYDTSEHASFFKSRLMCERPVIFLSRQTVVMVCTAPTSRHWISYILFPLFNFVAFLRTLTAKDESTLCCCAIGLVSKLWKMPIISSHGPVV